MCSLQKASVLSWPSSPRTCSSLFPETFEGKRCLAEAAFSAFECLTRFLQGLGFELVHLHLDLLEGSFFHAIYEKDAV